MTNNQTIIVFIITLVYLISLTFVLGAVGKDIPIGYDSEDYNMCTNPPVCTEKTFIGGIVTSVSSLPIWANTLFIIIPFLLLIVSFILLILHG